MADETIDIIFIITPKPGQHDNFIQLFNACASHARDHEPGTTRYHLQRGIKEKNAGADDLVVRETYANAEALKVHMQAPPVVAIMKAIMSGGAVQSSRIIHVKPEGTGFDRAVPKLKL